jgi:N6-adenosine-specific RNA methylase IME4
MTRNHAAQSGSHSHTDRGADPLEHFRSDYRVVVADPPWNFKSNSVARPGRNARRHYDCTVSLADISALPIKHHIAADAALFLWVPGPFLAIGAHLPLMRAWGFDPSGMGFVWIKLNPKAPQPRFSEHDLAMGGGYTTRKNAEFCLIGKHGKSVRQSASVHEVIIEPRREHSRKPEEFYGRIRQYSEGPYLELFGRQSRPGFDVWGDERNLFDEEHEPKPPRMPAARNPIGPVASSRRIQNVE